MKNSSRSNITVYMYTNTQNGKVYIGQTSTSIEDRAQGGRNYKGSRLFFEAIKQFGWGSFVPTILQTGLSEEEADEVERYYIEKYRSNIAEYGYNLETGGVSGFTHTQESKDMVSRRAVDRYKDPTKNPMYGRKHSDEARRKMRESSRHLSGKDNPNYGHIASDEERAAMSKRIKRAISEHRESYERLYKELAERARIFKYASKPVVRLEDNRVYSSITEAAADVGRSVGTLSGCLHGKSNTCAGYHYAYYCPNQTTIENTGDTGSE